jgi:tetratricopeptide (TPR) repeat protein
MHRTKGNLERSTENYQIALDMSGDLPHTALMFKYEIATNKFFQLQFEEAIPLIEEYINNSPSKNFKAYGGFKLGVCYWAVHGEADLDKIRSLYSRVVNEFQRPTMSFDQYAARLCQRFLDKSCFTK